MPNKITKFVTDVKTEMSKVSWSTKQELIGSTTVVLASVFLLAIFIGIVDLFLSKFVGLIIR